MRRDTRFVRIAAVALLCVPACNGAQPPPTSEPPTNSVEAASRPIAIEDAYTGIEEPMRSLIRSPGEWRDFWNRLASNRIPRPAPPDVDFSERVVVVAAMGTRPAGGYAIRIDSVRYAEDTLWVEVTSIVPAAACMTTQALTAPVAAVVVDRRPNVTARFLDREETLACE